MPALKNPRHEMFVFAVFQGQSARKAYQDNVGAVSDNVADASASRLLKTVKVAARLKELQDQMAERVMAKIVITKAYLEEKVHNLAGKAEDAGQLGVAKACYELLGRDRGVFTERKNLTVRRLADLSEEELEEVLAESNAPDQVPPDRRNKG